MNSFGDLNRFVAAMFRFLFSACFMDCFAWYEMVRRFSLPIRSWVICVLAASLAQKASVEKECQIYNLIYEVSFPCLRVFSFSFYQEFLAAIQACMMNVAKDSYVFPDFTPKDDGSVKISWGKPITKSLSDEIDPRNLLQNCVLVQFWQLRAISNGKSCSRYNCPTS
jgi:hypothetical protein